MVGVIIRMPAKKVGDKLQANVYMAWKVFIFW